MSRLTAATAASLTLAAALVILPAMGLAAGWLRWPALALLLAVTALLATDPARRARLTSPLFLLGALIILFYSVLPSLAPWMPDDLQSPGMRLWPARALDAPGEYLVLGFAASCLGAFSLAARRAAAAPMPPLPPLTRRLNLGMLAVSTTALAMLKGFWFGHPLTGLMEGPLLGLVCLGLGLAVLDGMARQRLAGTLALVAMVMAVLLAVAIAKIPLCLMAILAVAYLTHPVSTGRRWAVIAGFAALCIAIVASLNLMRGAVFWPQSGNRLHTIAVSLAGKVFDRQLETLQCLTRVAEVHATTPARDPGYFLVAPLVPRILWPEKPTLSNGRQIWSEYCTDAPGVAVAGHSASYTLLGEPLAQGGPVGLVVGGGFVIALLAGLSLAASRMGPQGTPLLLALSPWLVDPDQSLSLYWAMAAKMSLVLAAGWLILSPRGLASWGASRPGDRA